MNQHCGFFSAPWHYAVALCVAYAVPLLVAGASLINVDWFRGIFYSIHGGIAWLGVLASFFSVCVVALTVGKFVSLKLAVSIVIGYVPVSMMCAAILSSALSPPYHLTIRNTVVIFWFPLGLLFRT